MRFLADQDVYALTSRLLRQLGHDVVTAAEIGFSRAADTELLARAGQEQRLLVTRDKDFGGLVFVQHLGKGSFICELRPPPSKLLTRNSNSSLKDTLNLNFRMPS